MRAGERLKEDWMIEERLDYSKKVGWLKKGRLFERRLEN